MAGDWVRVARLDEIPEGSGHGVRVGTEEIALFRLDDEVFAVHDRCPHAHAELHTGSISDEAVITCSWHGWSFPLREEDRARFEGLPLPRSFPVRVADGEVWVRVDRLDPADDDGTS